MRTVFLVLSFVALVTADNLLQLANSSGATSLVQLAYDAGFANTLASGGPFTLFAPSNDAIALLPRDVLERLLDDKSYVIDMLKFHMVSGHFYTSQMTDEMVVPSLYMDGGRHVDIRFNIPDLGQNKLADGCKINLFWMNKNASNGVLHLIENVMYPFPLKNIPAELNVNRTRFSQLLSAIQKVNLTSTLAGGPFTLFAPNNAAFSRLPYPISEKLMSNATALKEVLMYHVSQGSHWSSTFVYYNMKHLQTLEGHNVTVTYDFKTGRTTVNDALLIAADIAVTNGAIHEINKVLLPPEFDVSKIY